MELLGLSDTAELTISLPSSPAETLSIDLHAGSLLVAPPLPNPIEQEPLPDEIDESWAGAPRLADVKIDDQDNDTGALVGRLWEATEDAGQLDEEWIPHDYEEEAGSRWRALAWIAGALGFVAVIVGAVWVLTNSPGYSVEDLEVAYGEVSTDLRLALDSVGSLTPAMTSIEGQSGDISEGAAALADLDAAARRTLDVAALTPASGPFQAADADIEALRANLRTASERSTALEQRLSEALTYRMLLDRSFQLPPLPYAITPDSIPALGVEMSLAVAETLEAVSQLPDDPAFASHRSRTEDFAGRLEAWQVEYLEAVRNDDLDATSTLIEEYETTVAELRSSVANPLRTIGEWTSGELDYIDTALDRADDLLAQS